MEGCLRGVGMDLLYLKFEAYCRLTFDWVKFLDVLRTLTVREVMFYFFVLSVSYS